MGIPYILRFDEIDAADLSRVGGKGANLGELTRAGFPVPPGFCLTTAAYWDFLATCGLDELLPLLDGLRADATEEIRSVGYRVRERLLECAVPEGIAAAVTAAWRQVGPEDAYALRSSATAEDLPTASFAGQQETYLNVRGEAQLLTALQKCWASLFTDRAIAYRAQRNIDHRAAALAVVVQRMVFAEVSGIMFTADPATGHRHTVCIDAGFGLGEALVSGIVSADLYRVRGGRIIERQVARKLKMVYATAAGGTEVQDLAADRQNRPALPDEKVLELARLGENIENHYGSEQDIEWCLEGDRFFVVQSRPVTSLYPVPFADDNKFRVFFSFAHVQMMMDAMKPLGASVWRTLIPFGKDAPGSYSSMVCEAGGRLFFDTTALLYWKPLRRAILGKLGVLDELMGDALSKVMAGADFAQGAQSHRGAGRQVFRLFRPVLPLYARLAPALIRNLFLRDHSLVVQRATVSLDRVVDKCGRSLGEVSGPRRITAIRESMGAMINSLADSFSYVPLGFIALPLARRLTKRWLGQDLDVDTLSRSLPGNVTSELGLMIGDLADTARQYPAVAAYLAKAEDSTFYEGLAAVTGGDIFRRDWDHFMERFGMRCAGEIDISNVRWREAPTLLVPAVLSHLQSNAPGGHREKFRRGRIEAEEAVQILLTRMRKTRAGRCKAALMSRLLSIYRNAAGLREFPKYAIVRLFGIYRDAILAEGESLRQAGLLKERGDVFYLALDELEALSAGRPSGDIAALVAARRKEFARYQKLTPPRIITSEGEVFTGTRSGVAAPAGALVGTPVSTGVAEGRVRVVFRPEEARLEQGDILVAPFTDPGWTPLFPSVRALVVEVGGLMTHGSVIAREYGIPAVVGVANATGILKDGQYVRVDGTKGLVQILAGKTAPDQAAG